MISQIETLMINRLRKITIGPTVPIKVYPPNSFRSLGKTRMAAIAISRYIAPVIDWEKAIPHFEVFTPSTTMQRIPVPAWGNIFKQWMADNLPEGVDYIEGPDSWTWQYAPTPVILRYQIDVLAALKEHREAIELFLQLEALPARFQPLVSGFYVNFLQDGPPENLDSLEDPLFRTAFRYEIDNVWIPRLQVYDAASIGQIIVASDTTTQNLELVENEGDIDEDLLAIPFGR